jgi:flagellar biosynthesis/type III secretory pathway protein FliH
MLPNELPNWFDQKAAEYQEAKAAHIEGMSVKFEEGKLEGDTTGFERGYKEGEVVGYNKGLAENANVPDGVFTEQELLNAKAEGDAAARAELQPHIEALGGQVTALQAEVADLKAAFEVDKAAAVSAKQAEMLADFESAEIDNAAVIAKYKV